MPRPPGQGSERFFGARGVPDDENSAVVGVRYAHARRVEKGLLRKHGQQSAVDGQRELNAPRRRGLIQIREERGHGAVGDFRRKADCFGVGKPFG